MKMRTLVMTLAAMALVASSAAAQTSTPSSKLVWDQPNADAATAAAYAYKVYPDGGANGVSLTGVTCSVVSGVTVCVVPFPAFTPGPHTLSIDATNVAGTSPRGPVLSFTFVVVPSAPVNMRIQ